MNAECFELQFESVLQRVKDQSIVVIDNAFYHSGANVFPLQTVGKMKCNNGYVKKGIGYDDSN